MTIAGAVLISAAVALTLTPMLALALLKAHGKATAGCSRRPSRCSPRSSAATRRARRLPAQAARLALLVLLASRRRDRAALCGRCRASSRRSRIAAASGFARRAPEGVSYEYMQRFMDDVAAATAERVPEAHLMMTQVPGAGGAGGAGAVNNGFVRLFLTDKSERARSQQEIAADLRGLAREFTAARINITQEASIGERRSHVERRASSCSRRRRSTCCARRCRRFSRSAQDSPVFTFVDSDLKFSSPEVQVTHRPRQGAERSASARSTSRRRVQAALERPALRLLHLQRQAVRRDRPAHARLALATRRSRQSRRAHDGRRRDGPPRQSRSR